jgi:hypothetical protein
LGRAECLREEGEGLPDVFVILLQHGTHGGRRSICDEC